jgi:hypothetical protein
MKDVKGDFDIRKRSLDACGDMATIVDNRLIWKAGTQNFTPVPQPIQDLRHLGPSLALTESLSAYRFAGHKD